MQSKSGRHSRHGESARGYEKLAKAVTALQVMAPPVEQSEHAHQQATATSVRRARHHGHSVEVITTYQFKIDGQPVLGHFSVDDAGKVHCHDLPNYAFSSALELGKRLVDLMPNGEAPADELNAAQPEPQDPGGPGSGGPGSEGPGSGGPGSEGPGSGHHGGGH